MEAWVVAKTPPATQHSTTSNFIFDCGSSDYGGAGSRYSIELNTHEVVVDFGGGRLGAADGATLSSDQGNPETLLIRVSWDFGVRTVSVEVNGQLLASMDAAGLSDFASLGTHPGASAFMLGTQSKDYQRSSRYNRDGELAELL
eukprot:5868965-Prymnesium_polylepis.1